MRKLFTIFDCLENFSISKLLIKASKYSEIVELSKISKWKILTFDETQTVLKKLFSPRPDRKLPTSLEHKISYGGQKYPDVCFPSALRMQFLGV